MYRLDTNDFQSVSVHAYNVWHVSFGVVFLTFALTGQLFVLLLIFALLLGWLGVF